MSQNLNQILSFLKPFKKHIGLYFTFNLLAVIFNLISLAMVIPFLRLLFNIDPAVIEKKPLTFSVDSILHNFNYTLAGIISDQGKAQALLYVCILVALVFLIKNLSTYASLFVLAPIRTGITKNVRQKIYQKLLYLPVSYFTNERKGDVITKMSIDVLEIEQSIISTIFMFFKEPLHLIIFLTALIYINAPLTLFVFVFIPLGGFLISKIAQFLRKSAVLTQGKLSDIIAYVEESLNAINIIKSFNADKSKIAKFKSETESLKKINTRMYRLKDLASPSSEFIAILLVISVLWYGGNLVLNGSGRLDAETFIAFIVIFSQIIPPAKGLSSAYYNLQKGLASLDRINSILNLDEVDDEKGAPASQFDHSIKFDNVSFAYDEKEVLKKISFQLNKGETVALVGSSGSGKSTIVDLVLKFYTVDKGQILFDNNNINNLRSKDIRNRIAIVNQQPVLFNDTIYNNITFGSENVTRSQVEEAAKIARVHDLIMSLKDNYDTNIGEGGNKLSGGEKQRITIARAIIKNADILILDEATSALDSENETLVKEAINELMQHKTVLIIAHRLSTVQNADKIIVLHEGEIIESGDHSSLMKDKDSQYSKMVLLQNV